MSYSMTASGLGFDSEDPQPDAITIEDIAHALSNICRYGGHTGSFYSVAQHSVLVSLHTDAKFARVALMHDASEAYIGDVIRPVKRRLGLAYSVIEDMVMHTIAKKFGFEWPMPLEVKAADELVGSTEWRDLMHHRPDWNLCGTTDLIEDLITPLPPLLAERQFLDRFDQLFGQIEFDYGPALAKALEGRDEIMARPIPPVKHGPGYYQWLKDSGLETPKSSSSGKRRPTKKSSKGAPSSETRVKNSTSSSKGRTSKGRKSTSRTPRKSK